MSEQEKSIGTRKIEHLDAFTKDAEIERSGGGFADITLTHRALPEINYDEIDTSCIFCNKRFSFPLLIASMTGGADQETQRINKNLAIACEEHGIGFAVGSQRIAFENEAALPSFSLRGYAPNAFIAANLGAVQLNYGFGLDECLRAIEIADANALFLHLNPLQEAVQTEGNRDFSGLIAKIGQIAKELKKIGKPLILKETGCGMSHRDIEIANNYGVEMFDIAGRGGTSWSRVEYNRRKDPQDNIGIVFQDWGIPTVQALKHACREFPFCSFIASGGIRSGIDIVKAVILGAEICSSAAPFLAAARVSHKAVSAKIRRWKREYQTAMFLLGCQNFNELRGNVGLILNRQEFL
ncbi:MAG: type 2 isopentenyl-diphosphate Delta-isomerase [Cardiobacteriaceae bacterium]|nr:type 2 isopentenyl-diphosphate Delta-isomerase [Cardiobacteriaceae bacterium]